MDSEKDFAALVEGAIGKRLATEEQSTRGRQLEAETTSRREKFWEGAYSREGLALRDAALLMAPTRRALAGLVSSMTGNSITPNKYIRSRVSHHCLKRSHFITPKVIPYLATKQEIQGWVIESEYPYLDGNARATDDLYISTDYRLYTVETGEKKKMPISTRRSLNEELIQSNVVNLLSEVKATWIEPPEHYWKG